MLLPPEELAIVADELPVAIWLGRVPSGEVVYTNRAFRDVLGIEPPDGAARGEFVEPYGVYLPDGAPYPESKMPFERAIAAGTTVVVDDLVIHRRDGRRVNLRVFAKPVFDARGTITHVLEAFTDITREVEAERARLDGERKLSRAQRLESIGQLVMGIAHDFNNLLTVTTLTTARLLANVDDEELRVALHDIETVTGSSAELVKKLLAFARRSPQPLAPVELGAIVQSVVGISRRTFERRLSLVADCAPEGAWIRGDQAQLEQVLMNLLVNARDAITGTGTIVVRTRRQALGAGEVETCPAGDYVVLEVIDDGTGIDPEIRDRVFEPYFTTKTRGPHKGTGLGLSTVLGIVRTHDGYIEVAEAHSRGTILRVAVPCHEQVVASPPALATPPAPLVYGAGQLVLVVDDEPLVRAATTRSLTTLGYRVLEAEDGQQALELFATRGAEIAAVVLDVVMPGPSAREVFTTMRRSRPDIPVLIITGSDLNDEIDALLVDGARTCLAKPFEATRFAEVLAAILPGAIPAPEPDLPSRPRP